MKMNNKYHIYLLFLGLIIFVITLFVVLFYESVPDIVVAFLCFLSLVLMLPNVLFSVRAEQEPTAITWKISISIIIATVFSILWLVICILRFFNLV